MEHSRSEQRYDRQLRLWDSHGQHALQSAKVCLINATATGSEILKNLVLPGVGCFTIIDEATVSPADTGSNFFTPVDSIGKSRGSIVTEMLMELNTDVTGDFITEDLVTLIHNKPEIFETFTLVIATSLTLKEVKALSTLLDALSIPIVLAQAYGMIGYLRLVAPCHPVVESHVENSFDDLRLDCPFPELSAFVDQIQLESLPDHRHRMIPYGVILLHYTKKWIAEHGSLPQTHPEKKQLKALIASGQRTSSDPSFDEENFEEAVRNAWKAYAPTKIPDQIVELMDRAEVDNVNRQSNPFWIKLRALKQFVANEGAGRLPLQGSIPDMEADSATYTQLQRIYSARADKDTALVLEHVDTLRRTFDLPHTSLTSVDVKRFCRNARELRVVRCRRIAEELNPMTPPDLNGNEENTRDINYYVMLRAVRIFQDRTQHYPGHRSEEIEQDLISLRQDVNAVSVELKLNLRVEDDYLHEICRYGGNEMHSIAAVMGGLGSQEAIKLITGQFVPIENTLIYNGLDNKCTVLNC